MRYQKTCGEWEVSVSEPHPAWVSIVLLDGGTTLHGLRASGLRDLRYLLDGAIRAAERAEATGRLT